MFDYRNPVSHKRGGVLYFGVLAMNEDVEKYYDLLGVNDEATDQEVYKSYRLQVFSGEYQMLIRRMQMLLNIILCTLFIEGVLLTPILFARSTDPVDRAILGGMSWLVVGGIAMIIYIIIKVLKK